MKRRRLPFGETPTDSAVPSGRHPEHERLLDVLATDRQDFARARRETGSARRRTADPERAFGLHDEWFSKMRRGKVDMGLDFFFHYLGGLGIRSSDFFRRAFPPEGGPADELARRLRALAGPRYEALRREHLGRPHAADDAAYARLRELMAPLDDLQKEDPRKAVGAIRRQLAKATDARLRGHWLALLAVAKKGVLRVADAAACGLVALDLAAETKAPLLRVDAMIASVALVVDGDVADYSLGADVMLLALVDAVRSQSPDAMGRVLLKRGILLDRGGQVETALAHYESAVELLRSILWRFGALQSAGMAALQLGDRDAAVAFQAAASRLEVPRQARGFSAWLRAETAAALGDDELALAAYSEARSLLDLSHPADWVLVAVQEARAHLRRSEALAAVRTLREAAPVAEALGDLGASGAAKAELLAAAIEGASALERAAALERLERLASRLAAASPLAVASGRSDLPPRDRTVGRLR